MVMASPSGPVSDGQGKAGRPPTGSETLPFDLGASFYRQMKPQRLYPLIVRLRENKKRPQSMAGPLHLRPVIPGAIVTPADYTLDESHSQTNPPFFITPLARGRLENARVEVYDQGRLVGTIALPMKAVTQCLTWVLLCLTFAIPYAAYWIATQTNLTRAGTKLERNTRKDREMNPANEPPEKKEGAQADGSMANSATTKLSKVGGGVEHALLHVLPDAPLSQQVAALAQDAYELVHSGPDYNLSFCIAALLLGATCISWATHTTWKGKRRAWPVH
jgi:hypothetical protein